MKSIQLTLLALGISGFSHAKIWDVTNSGTTFSPSTLTIEEGDSVRFTLAQSHNTVEVSQATWNINGNSALAGGFSTSFGGGLVLPTKLTQGTHYYVCAPHASFGMKAQIIVNKATAAISSDLISSISISPNPTSEILNINNSQNNLSYSIQDLGGKIIESGISISNSINIKHLLAGTYILIINDDKKSAIKFIKN